MARKDKNQCTARSLLINAGNVRASADMTTTINGQRGLDKTASMAAAIAARRQSFATAVPQTIK
jgi:hypothetical protein